MGDIKMDEDVRRYINRVKELWNEDISEEEAIQTIKEQEGK